MQSSQCLETNQNLPSSQRVKEAQKYNTKEEEKFINPEMTDNRIRRQGH